MALCWHNTTICIVVVEQYSRTVTGWYFATFFWYSLISDQYSTGKETCSPNGVIGVLLIAGIKG